MLSLSNLQSSQLYTFTNSTHSQKMSMATLLTSSSPTTISYSKPHTLFNLHHQKSYLNLLLLKKPTKTHLSIQVSTSENGSTSTTTAEEVKDVPKMETSEDSVGPIESVEASLSVNKFKDSRWVNGSWDLNLFSNNGSTDWDAVIDAEAKRRKWLETYPESTSNDEPIIFDTSIIPWWAWVKRFHLPEAELLNGRAAMIGFFMSYFVDSLTGLGVVDQMSNFFCKTLLFVSVLGVLFIRKNEDVEKLKKLLEETTFYDKQWQATWQEDNKKN
ncbi:hypothetical protein RND81_06G223300 [Saponaria officinalis]|uniref:Uncharacterized protein n=1 Tax=Saponaria officinalis TaxID=3572 RepID=A0AAW1KEC9_SAPOF